MKHQRQDFDRRQQLRSPCIEIERRNQKEDHHQGRLPICEGPLGVVYLHQGLNQRRQDEITTRVAREPSERRRPTGSIAEISLVPRRAELRYPMVLSAGRRSHGSHFRHRDDDGPESESGEDVLPHKASEAPIDQSAGDGDEDVLPGTEVH